MLELPLTPNPCRIDRALGDDRARGPQRPYARGAKRFDPPAAQPKSLPILQVSHCPVVRIEWRMFDGEIKVREIPLYCVSAVGGRKRFC